MRKTLAHFTLAEQLAPAAWAWCPRAYDSRLERDVAIKVLPPAAWLSADAESGYAREHSQCRG